MKTSRFDIIIADNKKHQLEAEAIRREMTKSELNLEFDCPFSCTISKAVL